jgi:hypothetical protein
MLHCWNRWVRLSLILLSVTLLVVSATARAEDFPGAKVVVVGAGRITFEHGGTTKRYPVDLALKILDDKGEAQDPVTGKRFLQKGNIVDITTKSVRISPKQDETRIVEVKFVSGKVADLPAPKPAGEVDLAPDPDFKGQVFGGDGYTSDKRWQAYIPTAKVGDFVEYERNGKPGRLEVVEVGPKHDYVIHAQVSYALDSRDEMRFKKRLPTAAEQPPSKTKAKTRPAIKSSAKTTRKSGKQAPPAANAKPLSEVIEVMDRQLECEIHYVGGQPHSWFSDEVPLNGLVKTESRSEKYRLTSFGRAK